jgi:hypothetical protein
MDDRVSPFPTDSGISHNSAYSVKFFKKGEKNVEAVLQRIDRLTQDEARSNAAETLGVVHGLVKNIRVVMDGTKVRSRNPSFIEYPTI